MMISNRLWEAKSRPKRGDQDGNREVVPLGPMDALVSDVRRITAEGRDRVRERTWWTCTG